MKFYNMARVYMSPETGDVPAGGGGDVVTPSADTPTESPAEAPAGEITPTETPEVVAPVVEPTGEDTTLPEKEVDKSKLSQVTGLVEQAGLTMTEVAEYAKANDGAIDLDTMVALKEKHGDAVATLIADQIKGIHAERTSEANARDKAVYDQVEEAFKDTADEGQTGEESWKELATWSKENVSNEHRAEINTLLAQGGLAAKLAVQELTNAFKEAHNVREFQDAELLEADTPAGVNGGNITKQDYVMEMRKLELAGHQYGTSAEMKKLDARRMKSINSGY